MNAEEVQFWVDLVLGDPPTDSAVILNGVVALERDAADAEALAKAFRVQAQRLRDFVATRQARMDGTPDPLLH